MDSATFYRANITKNDIVTRRIVTVVLATSIRLAFDASSIIKHRPKVDLKYEKIIDMLASMHLHTIPNKNAQRCEAWCGEKR